MTGIREFDAFGNDIHERIKEMFMKDKDTQEELRERFTQNPSNLREQFGNIEAGAMGFSKKNGQFVNDKGAPASDIELERIERAIDRVMLIQNPDIERNNLQFNNGFFYPLDLKKLIEKESAG